MRQIADRGALKVFERVSGVDDERDDMHVHFVGWIEDKEAETSSDAVWVAGGNGKTTRNDFYTGRRVDKHNSSTHLLWASRYNSITVKRPVDHSIMSYDEGRLSVVRGFPWPY
jgi:hypothetical protein